MNEKPWSGFAPNSLSQWVENARQELGGEDPFVKLRISKGNLSVLPYYNLNNSTPHAGFALPSSQQNFLGARGWYNAPKIVVENERQANLKALQWLNQGAEGIFFQLAQPTPDWSELFKDIQFPYCAIFLEADAPVRQTFLQFLTKHYAGATLPGAFFGAADEPATAQPGIQFSDAGITVAEAASPVETITGALMQAQKKSEELMALGVSAEARFQRLAFQVTIGNDFFAEMAKLRALRAAIRLLALAYGVMQYQPHIHAMSPPWIAPAYQPHGNLLKGTMAGLAAVLGGCDSLTIVPEEPNNTLMERMARNLSLLFREEAQLARVADPMAGSYYLENISQQMANEAWKNFADNA